MMYQDPRRLWLVGPADICIYIYIFFFCFLFIYLFIAWVCVRACVYDAFRELTPSMLLFWAKFIGRSVYYFRRRLNSPSGRYIMRCVA